MTDDIYWINEALKLSDMAAQSQEVPVGAVLVREGIALGVGYNQPIGRCSPTAHAEILAINQAAKSIGNYRLLNTTLYTTLEPCCMCAGALVHARVSRIVFGAYDFKAGACGTVFNLVSGALNHTVQVTGGIQEEACKSRLQAFFRARR